LDINPILLKGLLINFNDIYKILIKELGYELIVEKKKTNTLDESVIKDIIYSDIVNSRYN